MKEIAFNISARAAKLIGQENFSNAEGAIIELVKNCYDADATTCVILFDQSKSILYIIDDGDGMTEETISNYWMTIGTDNKNNNSSTFKKRIKTGAKGIGRFALDRLGINCELITKTKSTIPIKWNVSWSQFDIASINLSDVKATIEDLHEFDIQEYLTSVSDELVLPEDFFKNHFANSSGTAIKISSLRDLWSDNDILQLLNNLELLVPPLEGNTFNIYIHSKMYGDQLQKVIPPPFNDYDYKLEAVVDEYRKVEVTIYRNELLVSSLKTRNFFSESKLNGEQFSLNTFDEGEFKYNTSIEALLPGFKEVGKIEQLNKIGPFNFTFFFSKRGGSQEKDENERVFPYRSVDYAERSKLLNNFGGIKIFRDNFRVRPYGETKSASFDWLELGSRVVQNPTVTRPGYRVRPNQVYGIIKISRVNNIFFEDKSSREGLQENQIFSLFKALVVAIINVFEIDRNQIMMAVKNLYDSHNEREKAKAKVSNDIKAFKKKSLNNKSNNSENQQKLLEEAKDVINTSEEAIKALKEDIDELLNEQKILRVLASTGLTVSSFAHELKSLSGALVPRSDDLKLVLEELLNDNDIIDFPDYKNPYVMLADIRSDDERISQWLEFALSSLRKDKRKRIKIDLVEYIDKLQKTWSSLLSLKKINLKIEKTKFVSVYFTGYEIDLDSIFNNLISNSVEAFVRPNASSEREIILGFSMAPNAGGISIVYKDSGPGLSEEIVDLNKIFEPFFSTKRDPKTGELIGTGLGMWLVKSTIDEYKGTVKIDSNRPGFKLNITLPA